MGRPDDIRLRQQKEREVSNEVELLKDLIKQQSDMIKSLVDTVSKVQSSPRPELIQNTGKPTNFDDGLKEEVIAPRPKMGDFFINPSPQITITDSANLEENKEEKIVQENIDEEADRLKNMVRGRNRK